MIFLIKVLFCYLSYNLTYYLNNNKDFGPIKSSSLIGLFIGLIYQLSIFYNYQQLLIKDISAIMMGATFMGMLSAKHQHKNLDFAISSFIFCTLFINVSSYFNGFGGLLGTIACISILCVFGIENLLLKK